MTTSHENSTNHRKLALIIGNENYHRPENELSHSTETIQELSDLLTKIGFRVTTSSNLEKYDMTTKIISFSKTIKDGDLVLFYFSGHGYQVNGVNYLIPINDTWIKTNRDVEDFGINFNRILRRVLEQNSSYVNIFILDCCRPYISNDLLTSNCKYLDLQLSRNGVCVYFSRTGKQGFVCNRTN